MKNKEILIENIQLAAANYSLDEGTGDFEVLAKIGCRNGRCKVDLIEQDPTGPNRTATTPEQLAEFTIKQYEAMAEKKLTVQQSVKVLLGQVKILLMSIEKKEFKHRFVSDIAKEVLILPYESEQR